MSIRKSRFSLFLVLWGLFRAFAVFSQNDCYVQLDDASGFDVSSFQDELDAAACELAATFQALGTTVSKLFNNTMEDYQMSLKILGLWHEFPYK